MREQAWFFVFRDVLHLVWFCLPWICGYLAGCAAVEFDRGKRDFGNWAVGMFGCFVGWAANLALAVGYVYGVNGK